MPVSNVDDKILEFKKMVNNYKCSIIIMTAKNLKLFHCLTTLPKSLLDISKELNLDPFRIEPILNALSFYNLIEKDADKYFMTKYNDVLNTTSQFCQLDYIDFADNILHKWLMLPDVIKDKKLSKQNFQELTNKNAKNFVKGMDENTVLFSHYLIKNFHFDHHSILDIGAGSGAYSIQIAKEYSTNSITMIDLPEVTQLLRKKIVNEGLTNKINIEPCDYTEELPEGPYDDIFLFSIIHQENKMNLEKLLLKVYSLLKPEGSVFFTSFFLNEDKVSPESSVQFSIEMLLMSEKGKVYTHQEFLDLLNKVGFSYVKKETLNGPSTLYIARK